MRKPPDKPCESCEHAPCQLPLNCGRWLAYLSARRQYYSDKAMLKSARLRKVEDALVLKSTQKKREQWAKECPWEAPADEEEEKPLDKEKLENILARIRSVMMLQKRDDGKEVKVQFAALAYTLLREGLAEGIEEGER